MCTHVSLHVWGTPSLFAVIPMHPNMEVMCMVKSLILNFSIYATSVWLSLSHDPFLVLLLFPDLLVTVGSTAIPTSNFTF